MVSSARSISARKTRRPKAGEVAAGEHLIGEFTGDENGPSVIIIGSIHGNEPSGMEAMRRVAPGLEKLRERLRGRVYLVIGNTRALQAKERYLDDDLNRHWRRDVVARNLQTEARAGDCVEDTEQRELLSIFEGVFRTARDEVYALDLHSTSAESPPFAMIGDTLRNRKFARKFPATILLGIEEQLDATILEYINNLGAVTLGFEAGRHSDRIAVDNQEALIWLSLLYSGCLCEQDLDVARYQRVLSEAMGRSRIIEIRHRHTILPEDGFEMEPGFVNFQPVKRGERLARDRNGPIKAVESGLILMPLYQKLGSDGFFLGREILPFWLRLSRVLRKLRLGDWIHVLPGVNRHPDREESLMINTRVARLFPLQIFHLLGFRKRMWREGRLVVSRRKHDTVSPFGAGTS